MRLSSFDRFPNDVYYLRPVVSHALIEEKRRRQVRRRAATSDKGDLSTGALCVLSPLCLLSPVLSPIAIADILIRHARLKKMRETRDTARSKRR